jgi:hypothetical protein
LALVFAVLKVHQLELSFADNHPGLTVRVSADIELVRNDPHQSSNADKTLDNDT